MNSKKNQIKTFKLKFSKDLNEQYYRKICPSSSTRSMNIKNNLQSISSDEFNKTKYPINTNDYFKKYYYFKNQNINNNLDPYNSKNKFKSNNNLEKSQKNNYITHSDSSKYNIISVDRLSKRINSENKNPTKDKIKNKKKIFIIFQ